MSKTIKVAIVGMDTSHAVVFPRFFQDPKEPKENRIKGMKFTRALRFETPFQGKKGLDERQEYLESVGIKVTEDFDKAVSDCDAVCMEVNDPAYHLEYFKKCAGLGKPVFLDKPFAANLKDTVEILKIAKENKTRFFTASSLRYGAELEAACKKIPNADQCITWGPVGKAAAGSSIVWYGVHTFEMLEKAMGPGAIQVTTVPDQHGYVCTVTYADGRRGVVSLTDNNWSYGGVIRKESKIQLFTHTGGPLLYHNLLGQIAQFFSGKEVGIPLAESFEIMAMLEAAELSLQYGRSMPVYTMPKI